MLKKAVEYGYDLNNSRLRSSNYIYSTAILGFGNFNPKIGLGFLVETVLQQFWISEGHERFRIAKFKVEDKSCHFYGYIEIENVNDIRFYENGFLIEIGLVCDN